MTKNEARDTELCEAKETAEKVEQKRHEKTKFTRADEYDRLMGASRQRFAGHPAVASLFGDAIEPATLEAFLIYFSALGVRITEPVEDWIRRAGRRCGELGLSHLAKALEAHAGQEADHHLLMETDMRRLVDHWNESHDPKFDTAVLLALAPTAGVLAYRCLHENVIAGSAPYGQLAIEYEIEMLSVTYGPALIQRCTDLLGAQIAGGLSFLQDHVALDVGHTHFNRVQLSRLLEEKPDFLPDLVASGSAALDAYVMFLDDCLGIARQRSL